MSFGNRSNYATLKDAFGVPGFSQEKNNEEYKIRPDPIILEQRPIAQTPEIIQTHDVQENFEEDDEDDDVTCDMVKKHCSGCNCMGKGHSKGLAGKWFNELLNLILIGILLWVLVYKPVI